MMRNICRIDGVTSGSISLIDSFFVCGWQIKKETSASKDSSLVFLTRLLSMGLNARNHIVEKRYYVVEWSLCLILNVQLLVARPSHTLSCVNCLFFFPLSRFVFPKADKECVKVFFPKLIERIVDDELRYSGNTFNV